jgi:glycosyltransferase involved in cell wall biosynthesis
LKTSSSQIASVGPNRSRPIDGSISLLLPVHNAQATLADSVGRILELLPELAARFEVLVIDDGSADATSEIALELATQYPQVKVLRHAQRKGFEPAWRLGLARTDATVVVGHDGQSRLDPADVVRLLRGAEVPSAPSSGMAARSAVRSSSQFQRWLAARSAAAAEPPASAGGFSVLRHDTALGAAIRPILIERPSSEPSLPRRPQFMTRLKNFALGE